MFDYLRQVADYFSWALGAFLGKENVGWLLFVGLVAMLLGVMLVNSATPSKSYT